MNDEYQRQIIIRLKEISDWMLSELDTGSNSPSSKHSEFVTEQVSGYLEHRQKTNAIHLGDFFGVDPWLYGQFGYVKVKNDPFVPQSIRNEIFSLYFDRLDKMTEVMDNVLKNSWTGWHKEMIWLLLWSCSLNRI